MVISVNKWTKVLTAALAIAVVCAGVFYQQWKAAERTCDEQMILISQSQALRAYEAFSRYLEDGAEQDYHLGVSAFRTLSTINIGVDLTQSTYRSDLYAYMVQSPAAVQECLPLLLDVLGKLQLDPRDETAYTQMAEIISVS